MKFIELITPDGLSIIVNRDHIVGFREIEPGICFLTFTNESFTLRTVKITASELHRRLNS
ncbi:hypothetical protein [Empedobacter brevis]|uniref:hypothetical protein n=1 Tax=Empedobacter brevis TaxID=247 RepID=UPI00333FCAA8